MKPSRRELLWGAGMASIAGKFQLDDAKGEKVSVRFAGKTLLEYRYSADRPKTYIHPLCLADGRPITLDSPADHVHHRGLMAAWSEVNGIDFWGETNPARHGSIVHQRFDRVSAAPFAEIVSVNNWVAEGKLLLVERRTVKVPEPTDDGVWLEWITELTAVSGPVKLAAGEHVYNGLGIRFVPSMDGGSVLNSNGTNSIAKANGQTAVWCSYFAKGAGAAFFDHPQNPRHPNAFFVMNNAFGYMSAAPTYREPFELAKGSSIRFRWGVLAFAGDAVKEKLDRRFRAWKEER